MSDEEIKYREATPQEYQRQSLHELGKKMRYSRTGRFDPKEQRHRPPTRFQRAGERYSGGLEKIGGFTKWHGKKLYHGGYRITPRLKKIGKIAVNGKRARRVRTKRGWGKSAFGLLERATRPATRTRSYRQRRYYPRRTQSYRPTYRRKGGRKSYRRRSRKDDFWGRMAGL